MRALAGRAGEVKVAAQLIHHRALDHVHAHAAAGQLGANPAEALIRSLGDWALRFLCLTLAVTPLRLWTGWHALARFRRDHMGVVFQSFHLIPTMTALENVAIPLELARVVFASSMLDDIGRVDRLDRREGELGAVRGTVAAAAGCDRSRSPGAARSADVARGVELSARFSDMRAELVVDNESVNRRSVELGRSPLPTA